MGNTDYLWLGLDFDENSTEPINFIETRLLDLSPFSAHEVKIEDVKYKTAEHAYQALRVVPEAREIIMNTSSPMDAWREGQKCKQNKQIIEGHNKYELMEKIFRAKLEQHSDVREVLRLTGKRVLLKIYDTDYYWGTGADGSGENQMGKIWMKLREEFI
jgi:N-glycosidase YbiA